MAKRSDFSWTEIVELVQSLLRTGLVAKDAPSNLLRSSQESEVVAQRVALMLTHFSNGNEDVELDWPTFFSLGMLLVNLRGKAFYLQIDKDPVWRLYADSPVGSDGQFVDGARSKCLFQHHDPELHHSMGSYLENNCLGLPSIKLVYSFGEKPDFMLVTLSSNH